MQASPLLSLSPSSPSFSNYSSANLAEIAARVVEEFRKESVDSSLFDWESEDFYSQDKTNNNNHDQNNSNNNNIIKEEDDIEDDDNDDEEFEFAFVCRRADSTISADEIFCNGQIKPIYPLFNTDLIFNDTQYESTTQNIDNNTNSTTNNNNETASSKPTSRLPLGKLMNEERETTSCSSSEAGDLDNLQPGTYCVWAPKASGQDSPGTCKKSNSTGSSKRWKFRDLLYRSNSEGKDKFVFLTPSTNKQKTEKVAEESKDKGKVKASEGHYATRSNRAVKEDDKRKSFLPYRQDVVGFFNNINGLSRNLHPF